MNTPAIHHAMRLLTQPDEMAWLCFPDSDLPEGVSDLLRLCSSKEKLIEFSHTNGFDTEQLSTGLFNFIEKAIINENNSDEKILGGDKFSSSQQIEFHYQLLMRIYDTEICNRPNAAHLSSVVTNAYERIKEGREQGIISFSENRRQANNIYKVPANDETDISIAKTAIAVVSAFGIFALVAMTGKLNDPANPEIIAADNVVEENIKENIVEVQKLTKISAITSSPAREIKIDAIQATSTKLQSLIKELEVAYEEGNVDVIKPLLANAPEIKNQSDKQLNDKLETLFEITDERKMVLFDFKWTSSADTLEGKGKFLSRYKLVGEKKWLTREGTALVSAKDVNKKLKITQLILENQTFD